MKYDHIFDSSNCVYETKFEFDRSKSEAITVFFEKENVVLYADIHGNATFENLDGTVVSKDKAESKRYFSFIYCKVQDNIITVRFPITETVDHYPNCDGEYDRYSEIIVDNIYITCHIE